MNKMQRTILGPHSVAWSDLPVLSSSFAQRSFYELKHIQKGVVWRRHWHARWKRREICVSERESVRMTYKREIDAGA